MYIMDVSMKNRFAHTILKNMGLKLNSLVFTKRITFNYKVRVHIKFDRYDVPGRRSDYADKVDITPYCSEYIMNTFVKVITALGNLSK